MWFCIGCSVVILQHGYHFEVFAHAFSWGDFQNLIFLSVTLSRADETFKFKSGCWKKFIFLFSKLIFYYQFFFCIFCMFDNPITLLSKGIELNWIPRYDVELLFSDKNKRVDSYQLLKVVCVLGYIWSFCVVFMKKCSVWNWSWLKADLHVTSLDNVIPYMFSTYSFLERV